MSRRDAIWWQGWWAIGLVMGLAMLPQVARGDDQAGQLRDKAKQAHAFGLLDQEASYLCEAAKLDPNRMTKRCDEARTRAAGKLQEFEGDLGTAKFEFAHMDFPGAIRDLEKITFGPHNAEAQHLLDQAKAVEAAGGPTAFSQSALRQAQTMYGAGNFAGAVEMANRVMTPALRGIADQIVRNVEIYRETMATGDELASAAHAKEAGEKYSFAMSIKANGPGDPAGKKQRMEALAAEQQQQAASSVAASKVAPPPASALSADTTIKMGRLLARARHAERAGDLRGALTAYEGVLGMDATLAHAVAGRARVQAMMARKPIVYTAALLANGIRGYYQAHFDEAAESLSSYLATERKQNQGAAHFYLGASLISEAMLGTADGGEPESGGDLRRSATEQFRLAHTAGYRPVESQISPKVMTEWIHACGGSGSSD